MLSEFADKDFEDIFDYTFHEFGLEQASKYLNEIDLVCDSLALQELMGLSRLEINEEMRSFVYRYRSFFTKLFQNIKYAWRESSTAAEILQINLQNSHLQILPVRVNRLV
jgi:plasmid stabilization system protein ParE